MGCERKFCKFTHPKKVKKPESAENKKQKIDENKKNPSGAHSAEEDSKLESFLEQWASKFTKMLAQMDSKIEANINNNRMGYQSAAFPQLVMQQNPQLQPMQRLV